MPPQTWFIILYRPQRTSRVKPDRVKLVSIDSVVFASFKVSRIGLGEFI
jgi:hypothetical protein